MKHMSLYLDLFILLDTVRIVLTGGVADDPVRRDSRTEAVSEWNRLKLEHENGAGDFSSAIMQG
jgi:hypothetical protein